MKKLFYILTLFTSLFFFLGLIKSVRAQTPAFNITNQGITELKINNQNFGYPVEITPLTFSQGAGKPQLYVLPSGWSWLCSTTGNLLNSSPSNPLTFMSQNCKLITKMDIVGTIQSNGQPVYLNPTSVNYSTPWKLTYDGPFGLNVINDNRLVALRHGENINSIFAGYRYQNTVFPNVPIYGPYQEGTKYWPDGCLSGYYNGVYEHCGTSFTTYANLGWANYNPATGWNKEEWHDEGPVLWPPGPPVYREANGARGMAGGPYHTTTYLNNDGYMYTYTIAAPGTQAGHDQCNIVAKSPISGNLMPGTWKYYYNGTFSSNALPAGFSKERINDFYSTPAGPATCIFSGTENIKHLYFNVAKIKNTPYFIGAEESLPANSWRMGVRISADLVHWSDITVLSTAAGWGSGQQFSYPTFYNKDGTTSNEIDPQEFYIVGNGADAGSGYKLYKMKLSLTLNYPANLIEPMVRQYYGEFLNRTASDSDLAFHVNYFKQYGCQADLRAFANSQEFSSRKYNTAVSDYVRILTRAILSRDPDSPYWVNMLNSGFITRDAVAEAFITSPEAGGVCASGKVLKEYASNTPPTSMPIPPTATPTPPDFPAFLNLFHTYYHQPNPPSSVDLDKNGTVDIFDYNMFMGNMGSPG